MTTSNTENTIHGDTKEKITILFEVIKRYDGYIVSTNAKASLIIAFNSLILGTILLKFGDIISFYTPTSIKAFVGILLVLITISSLISLFFVFGVVYPYFGNHSDEKNQRDSMIYFGSVSKMSAYEYFDKIELSSSKEIMEDLSSQVTILARGLNEKMIKMRRSIGWITFGLVLVFFLVIFRAIQAGG